MVYYCPISHASYQVLLMLFHICHIFIKPYINSFILDIIIANTCQALSSLTTLNKSVLTTAQVYYCDPI